jgi:type VI secretion system secreted protein VgrG
MALLARDTTVVGPFPQGTLLLETLTGTEELAAPFAFELNLLSAEHALASEAVLGKELAVGIKLDTGDWRYFHGVVSSFAKVGTSRRHTRYAARLVPKLSLCDHTADCRVFNDPSQDAVSIATAVLAGRGVAGVEAGALVEHALRKREYCVQYQESDLHFAQRLLEEEGIYYFFRHDVAKHTMVLADSVTAHQATLGYEVVPYTADEQNALAEAEHFWGMSVRKSLYPGQHTVLAGYDPAERRKTAHLGESSSNEPAPGSRFEHYDHPGGLCDPEEANREARLRTQASRADNTVLEVEGNTMGLGVGALVRLRPGALGEVAAQPFWSADGFGKQYLVVGAKYSLSIDQYETGTVAGSDQPFRATYVLLDTKVPFRPRRTAHKPRMGGPQTALVVGPAGEEIWTDKLGRVRVQFDWDRKGGHDEKSTCWVRMAQTWADGRWGSLHLPRIGQEVLVRFLDGDPDRPIVAGALYNRNSMPPYELPSAATQSGIKSRSSKHGSAENFNEIRFEDEKGAEELHVHAEKDMSTVVENCQTLAVGKNRTVVVGHDEDNRVKSNRELTVNANDSVVVGGHHDKTVTGRVVQICGSDHSRKVDGDQDLVEEQNKDEHVKQAHTLTTDKKFQLVQDATSMTFKQRNVTLRAGGEVVVMAGGATFSMDTKGATTLDGPGGVKLVCGASSLTVSPGGVALASPNLTIAVGAGSVMALGSDAVSMNSRKVHIEAAGVCDIKGNKKIKLQESKSSQGKQKSKSSVRAENEAAAKAKEGKGKAVQKGADPKSSTLEIHVVDLNEKSQAGLAYEITKPDGDTEKGTLDSDGRAQAKSKVPGKFSVTFPDLDGADWDGDGAEPLPPESQRTEASRYTVQQGDRLPTIASDHGFVRWQTIWDFPGNAALKDLRGNAHILLPKDKVVIPTKLARKALTPGGMANYVVRSKAEVLRVRFAAAEADESHPIRFRAQPEVGLETSGTLKVDGTMEIDLPEDTRRLVVELFNEGSEPFEIHTLEIGHLDPIQAISGVQARLANLGYYEGSINGKLDEATLLSIGAFRRLVMGEQSTEIDGAFIEALKKGHGA